MVECLLSWQAWREIIAPHVHVHCTCGNNQYLVSMGFYLWLCKLLTALQDMKFSPWHESVDCMIEAIANPEKERMKHDNTNLSLWMQSKSHDTCHMIKTLNISLLDPYLSFIWQTCMGCASVGKYGLKSNCNQLCPM